MSYWSWLKGSLKPKSVWEKVKPARVDLAIELCIGGLGVCFFPVLGICIGIRVDPRYFLLLLGTIPSFLILTYGLYRVRQER